MCAADYTRTGRVNPYYTSPLAMYHGLLEHGLPATVLLFRETVVD